MNTEAATGNSGEIRVNYKVRDSVFSSLLQQKKYFLQVYRELYPNSEPITQEDLDYITIENVLAYGRMYNDLAVSIKNNSVVVFLEAQST